MTKKNTHNEHGFNTPKEYFNNFEENLKASLFTTKQDSGLKTPENYFDNLEEEVLKKVTKPKGKVIRFSPIKITAIGLSIAASILLLLTLQTPETNNSYDYELAENYLIEEFSDDDLYELVENDNLSESEFIDYNTNNYINDLSIDDLTTEEL